MASPNMELFNVVERVFEDVNVLVTLFAATKGKPADAVLRASGETLRAVRSRLAGHLRALQEQEARALPPLPARRLRVKIQALTNALDELLADGATAREQGAAWGRACELLEPIIQLATLASRAVLKAERRRFEGR